MTEAAHRRRNAASTHPDEQTVSHVLEEGLPQNQASEEEKPAKPLPRRKLSATLLTFVIILLIWRGLSLWAEMSEWEEEDSELPPTAVPVKVKKKKLGSDVDIVEVKSRSGWNPQLGSLVEKRPPRPCLTTNIAVQVFDPIVYISKNKDWKRRAYACMLKSGCRQGLLEDAEDRRWKKVKSLDVTFVFKN